MNGPSRIDSPNALTRINTKLTDTRQAVKSDFGSRVKDGVSVAAGAAASGAAAAAPFVPGGAIVSAAITGVDTLAASRSSGQQIGARATALPGAGLYGGSVTGSVGTGGVSASGTIGVGSQQFQEGTALLEMQQASNMQFLALQNQMQQENQKFSTLSNVLKVRHDTAKNSIQNIH